MPATARPISGDSSDTSRGVRPRLRGAATRPPGGVRWSDGESHGCRRPRKGGSSSIRCWSEPDTRRSPSSATRLVGRSSRRWAPRSGCSTSRSPRLRSSRRPSPVPGRGVLRRGRRRRQGRAQAHRGPRGLAEVDPGGAEGPHQTLRTNLHPGRRRSDPRGRDPGVAGVRRGEARGRRGAQGQRPRLDDPAARVADRRPAHASGRPRSRRPGRGHPARRRRGVISAALDNDTTIGRRGWWPRTVC